MPHKSQVQKLREAIFGFVDGCGVELVRETEAGVSPFLEWLQFLGSFKRTGTADEILDAVASSIRESAACIALGLVRPALFSMRTQIDLILAWLYFKDHPVEWRVVNTRGDGFKLKKELFEYLSGTVAGFSIRHGILTPISTRKEVDTYRLLSAHIHGQSNPVLPVMRDLSDLVRSEALCKQATALACDLSEYVGDVLYAVYAPEFASLPATIVQSIDRRFATEKQKREFYESI